MMEMTTLNILRFPDGLRVYFFDDVREHHLLLQPGETVTFGDRVHHKLMCRDMKVPYTTWKIWIEVMKMERVDIEKRMDWGLFARDIICALQQLHTYMETDDAKYLVGLDEELKSMLEDLEARDDLEAARSIIEGEIQALEKADGYLSVDQCGGLQGSLEGLHTRILYETHPVLKALEDFAARDLRDGRFEMGSREEYMKVLSDRLSNVSEENITWSVIEVGDKVLLLDKPVEHTL